MTLMNCPECSHRVSTYATMCPNCGYEEGIKYGWDSEPTGEKERLGRYEPPSILKTRYYDEPTLASTVVSWFGLLFYVSGVFGFIWASDTCDFVQKYHMFIYPAFFVVLLGGLYMLVVVVFAPNIYKEKDSKTGWLLILNLICLPIAIWALVNAEIVPETTLVSFLAILIGVALFLWSLFLFKGQTEEYYG